MWKKIKWLAWQFILGLGGMACVVLMFTGAVGIATWFGGTQGAIAAVLLTALAVLYVDAKERKP